MRLFTFFRVLTIFSLFFLAACFAFAQDMVPTDQFLEFMVKSISDAKGASALMIAFISVQALIQFLKTPVCGMIFKNLKGKYKLLLVSGLSVIAGVLSLMAVGGLNLSAALMHSATLSAFSVYLNQFYKQVFEKND